LRRFGVTLIPIVDNRLGFIDAITTADVLGRRDARRRRFERRFMAVNPGAWGIERRRERTSAAGEPAAACLYDRCRP